MDAGAPPPLDVSQEAHAGCLSFELSSARSAWSSIAACRRSAARPGGRSRAPPPRIPRSSFNDTSSCRFLESRRVPRLIGVADHRRTDACPVDARGDRRRHRWCTPRHDGYADRFGVVHERALALSADGTRLDGEDLFMPGARRPRCRRRRRMPSPCASTCIRPSRPASCPTGTASMLMLPNREAWTFDAYEDRRRARGKRLSCPAPDGPRRTVQIVISGHARQVPQVHWSFAHIAPSAQRRTASAARNPNCRCDAGRHPRLSKQQPASRRHRLRC